MWGPAYPCLIEYMAYPGILFIYVFFIPGRYLIKVQEMNFDDFKLSCCNIYHFHAGEGNILPGYSTAWMLFSY